MFASSIGTPVEPRNVNRRWDELRRRAGLDWLRLHDLRHYADGWVMCPAVAFPLAGAVGPVLQSA